MHETVAPLQLGLSVAGSFGIVGALLAAGALIGRPTGRTKRALEQADVVTDNVAAGRFEIRVDGELAGFAEYQLSGDLVTFNHTEIDPSMRGRGLAATLISFALESSREAGLNVVANCPYVHAFIEKHSEYSDLLASVGSTTEETEGCCALPS